MRKPRCVILSPHLDDAVLSCGGLIAALEGHASVEIWTFFTRGSARGPFSPTALWLHGATSSTNPTQLYFQRREEDRAACKLLGAQWRHFNWVDAPYRKGPDRSFLYPDDLSGSIHPEDERLVADIRTTLAKSLSSGDLILAPFAANSHVDHSILRKAAEGASAHLVYYPDIPYALMRIDGAEDPKKLQRVEYHLSEEQIEKWTSAAGCFATQLFLLESSVGNVSDMIVSYAQQGLYLLADEGASAALDTQLANLLPLQRNPAKEPAASRATFTRVQVDAVQSLKIAPDRAPIAVVAFRRLDLLQQTLRSLEECDTFSGSEVVVYSDAARPRKPDEALAVGRVRSWLRDWCHEHGALLVEAKKNRGLKTSITSAVSQLTEAHGRVIVLEDDLVMSRQFLVFMNEALEKFKDREDIVQISGYMVPHDMDLDPIGLLRAPGSWGWATWARAWRYYRDDPASLMEEIKQTDSSRFDFDDTYAHLEALERNATGQLETWLIRWYASVFLRGGLTVYPCRSLVRNIGFGDEGENCKPGPTARIYARQPIARQRIKIDASSVGTKENPDFAQATREFYRWQQYQWVKPSLSDRVRGKLNQLTSHLP